MINNIFSKLAQLCNPKKKKCGAHTHAHHLSQLSSPIFTSVVVYSRTTPKTQKIKNQTQWNRKRYAVNSITHCATTILFKLCSCTQKKMRSTHACTPSFAHLYLNIHGGCFFSSTTKTKIKKKQIQLIYSAIICFFSTTPSIFCKPNLIKRSKKKYGAHTHAHHLSRISISIFTSVVVYSRTTQTNKTLKKNYVVLRGHRMKINTT